LLGRRAGVYILPGRHWQHPYRVVVEVCYACSSAVDPAAPPRFPVAAGSGALQAAAGRGPADLGRACAAGGHPLTGWSLLAVRTTQWDADHRGFGAAAPPAGGEAVESADQRPALAELVHRPPASGGGHRGRATDRRAAGRQAFATSVVPGWEGHRLHPDHGGRCRAMDRRSGERPGACRDSPGAERHPGSALCLDAQFGGTALPVRPSGSRAGAAAARGAAGADRAAEQRQTGPGANLPGPAGLAR